MRILVIDDDRNICDSISWVLTSDGHQVAAHQSGEQGLAALENDVFDLAFLDVKMPGMGGLATLEKLAIRDPHLKVIMISGQADVSTAVIATKLGAYDFLEKPLNPEKILLEVKKLNEQSQVRAEMIRLKVLVEMDYEMVGQSQPMQTLRQWITKAAASDSRILIYGENGTGKELVARALHNSSQRATKPFVQLNCAAIPKELIESELFGYEKGAFTGATRRKTGLIQEADGGTLFLDEVGDMALETQAKLLRVLQENEFTPVGGTVVRKFDVRILSATNKDLGQQIKGGHFRQDLYFRLAVIPIQVPPLRERADDIPELSEHFMRSFMRKSGRRPKAITPEAFRLLQSYPWPGNVRELKNILERLAIMSEAETIDAPAVSMVLMPAAGAADLRPAEMDDSMPLKTQLAHLEKAILQRGLQKYQGNISRLALALGADRANLYRKLRQYGLH